MADATVTPFDVQSLRQASEMPWPAGDPKAQMQLYVCCAQDLWAAADEIVRLNALVAELEAGRD